MEMENSCNHNRVFLKGRGEEQIFKFRGFMICWDFFITEQNGKIWVCITYFHSLLPPFPPVLLPNGLNKQKKGGGGGGGPPLPTYEKNNFLSGIESVNLPPGYRGKCDQ